MASWCQITVFDPDGSAVSTSVLEGPGLPDLAAVDVIAQRILSAVRAGQRLVLSDVAPELMDLLELAAVPVEVLPS